jgi:hypothetical protein
MDAPKRAHAWLGLGTWTHGGVRWAARLAAARKTRSRSSPIEQRPYYGTFFRGAPGRAAKPSTRRGRTRARLLLAGIGASGSEAACRRFRRALEPARGPRDPPWLPVVVRLQWIWLRAPEKMRSPGPGVLPTWPAAGRLQHLQFHRPVADFSFGFLKKLERACTF